MINETLTSTAISAGSIQAAGFPVQLSSATKHSQQAGTLDFGDLFRSTVGQVDGLEQKAHSAIEGLMTGNGVDVHQAVIAAEKANAAFELALAIRNKAVQSYQGVMSMQF